MIFAIDLDGSVIHSNVHDPTDLVVVEHYAGRAHSFLTPRAAVELEALATMVVVMPATTRIRAQYERVRMPWGPVPAAVIANGAGVLLGGRLDPEWDDRVRAELANLPLQQDSVFRIAAEVASSSEWGAQVRDADGWFVYLVDRGAPPSGRHIGQLHTRLNLSGWELSRQGRKTYLMPSAVDKRLAVTYAASRVRDQVAVAVGDSLLDLSLLLAAPRAAYAAEGELAQSPMLPTHAVSIPGHGVMAGERMASWLLRQAQDLARTAL